MKRLLTGSFIRAVIIVVASTLLIGGVVYAQQSLWSAEVILTIETPTGEANLVITGVSVTSGTYNDDTGVWAVSIPRGGWAALTVYLCNDGGDGIMVRGVVEGETVYHAVDGISISASSTTLAAGESGCIVFQVPVGVDAEPGELPAIQLEVK